LQALGNHHHPYVMRKVCIFKMQFQVETCTKQIMSCDVETTATYELISVYRVK
jgi:hypothetical protein